MRQAYAEAPTTTDKLGGLFCRAVKIEGDVGIGLDEDQDPEANLHVNGTT